MWTDQSTSLYMECDRVLNGNLNECKTTTTIWKSFRIEYLHRMCLNNRLVNPKLAHVLVRHTMQFFCVIYGSVAIHKDCQPIRIEVKTK